MLIVTKRRYKKQYVYGGAGIFDTISRFFKSLFTSQAAKQIASTAVSAGKDAAKKALDVGTVAAIDVGKRLVDKAAHKLLAGRRRSEGHFVPLHSSRTLARDEPLPVLPAITPKNQEVIAQLTGLASPGAHALQPEVITQKSMDTLARLIGKAPAGSTNINKLLAGSGVMPKKVTSFQPNAITALPAIAIQDLVRRLNGAGMKIGTK
jgi:hypothetical protein